MCINFTRARVIQHGEWQIDTNQVLGEGASGKIYLGYSTRRRFTVAVKEIKRDYFRIIEAELALRANQLNHPNLMKYLDSFESGRCTYIILERCNGGDLKKKLDKLREEHQTLSELEIKRYGKQLLEGLNTLHRNKITHRDIKPANILIHNGQLKIGDLGYAHDRTVHLSKKGTPLYSPPEYYNWDIREFTMTVDIWAFGVVLHEMVFGSNPFDGRSLDEVAQNINNGYRIPEEIAISIELQNILTWCLQQNADQRPTAQQLLDLEYFRIQENAQDEDLRNNPFDERNPILEGLRLNIGDQNREHAFEPNPIYRMECRVWFRCIYFILMLLLFVGLQVRGREKTWRNITKLFDSSKPVCLNQQQFVSNHFYEQLKDPEIAGARGLATDEPLDFDTIIRSLYANPERYRYPLLWYNSGVCLLCLITNQQILPINIEENEKKIVQ